MKRYVPSEIEPKWQEKWEKEKLFLAKNPPDGNKFYVLVEFPYPSGEGLHVGHTRSWSAMDAYARKKRMEGFNVLYPIGWDAFGLPAENFARKTGQHPEIAVTRNIERFKKQCKLIGLSFDWSREINTTDPSYYKWTQWIFVKLFEKGLAYQADVAVNWCSQCETNLADEEVLPNGTHERCNCLTEKRMQKQWMLKITKYADRLLNDLDKVDYPKDVKLQQKNWIGKSEGTEVSFPLEQDLNYVLLHGFKGSSREDFFPWLESELKKTGRKVFNPDLPDTFSPSIEEQVDYVLKNWDINENTVMITHSLGGVVAFKLLTKLKKPMKKLILLAPPLKTEFLDGKKREELIRATDWKFDFEEIKKKAKEIVVIRDLKDDVLFPSQPVEIAKRLNAKLIDVVANGPHFNCEEVKEILEEALLGIKVFTTRPDTLFGVSAIVISPEHKLLNTINNSGVKEYIEKSKNKSELERTDAGKAKTGVFTGLYVINPINKEKIPVWVGDYVVGWYGKGAVMVVPAHDQRDFEFAKKYNLSIKKVIEGEDSEGKAYSGEGKLINSGNYSGINSKEARSKITEWLKENGFGGKAIEYRLRDWVFSRQHYWGEPIPVIHCSSCGIVSVNEKDLPVKLPHIEKYEPSKTGESPLAKISEWVNVKCPKCNQDAKRETDTMPNWAGSNWYFLRYLDPKNDRQIAAKEKMDYWMPVDLYQGGYEHTTLHLLYSRFIYKFLFDIGVVGEDEPYKKRRVHGIILGPDMRKMSKSFGNVINPDDIVKEYGADTLRTYEMFMGPFDQTISWSDESLAGCFRFLKRIWQLSQENVSSANKSAGLMTALNKTIKKVGNDIESMKFNTAVASMMEFINEWQKDKEGLSKEDLKKFIAILYPFAPHIAEEIWEGLGESGFLQNQKWPEYDKESIVGQEITIVVQVNGKVRDTIKVKRDEANEENVRKLAMTKKVSDFLGENSIKKVVYIKDRAINLLT